MPPQVGHLRSAVTLASPAHPNTEGQGGKDGQENALSEAEMLELQEQVYYKFQTNIYSTNKFIML